MVTGKLFLSMLVGTVSAGGCLVFLAGTVKGVWKKPTPNEPASQAGLSMLLCLFALWAWVLGGYFVWTLWK